MLSFHFECDRNIEHPIWMDPVKKPIRDENKLDHPHEHSEEFSSRGNKYFSQGFFFLKKEQSETRSYHQLNRNTIWNKGICCSASRSVCCVVSLNWRQWDSSLSLQSLLHLVSLHESPLLLHADVHLKHITCAACEWKCVNYCQQVPTDEWRALCHLGHLAATLGWHDIHSSAASWVWHTHTHTHWEMVEVEASCTTHPSRAQKHTPHTALFVYSCSAACPSNQHTHIVLCLCVSDGVCWRRCGLRTWQDIEV